MKNSVVFYAFFTAFIVYYFLIDLANSKCTLTNDANNSFQKTSNGLFYPRKETTFTNAQLNVRQQRLLSILSAIVNGSHPHVGSKNCTLINTMLCYYVGPSSESQGLLQPAGLDPFLCSHIIFFARASIVGDIIQLENSHFDEKKITELVDLKRKNNQLKILISITKGFSELVTNDTAVKSFAYNARLFLETHKLDGLDLDWEFPSWSNDPKTGEKSQFVYLVDKLSTTLRLVEPKYLLTAAVTGIKPILDNAYDIPALAVNLDFMSMMGYDYSMYQWYLPFTGHNAPLYSKKSAKGYFATLNVASSVQAILDRGLSEKKFLLGVPTYGRTWRLMSPTMQSLASPAIGEGFGKGYISFAGAESFLRNADIFIFDEDALVPYAARGTDWISYENIRSAQYKASLVKAKGLAGAMMFSLNSDDWAGVLGKGQFPLHNAVKQRLSC